MENALDFIGYLKENEIMPETNPGYENNWAFDYLGENICVIVFAERAIPPGPWTVFPGDYDKYDHKDFQVDDSLKEYAWANINFCAKCSCGNNMEASKTIFGKDFEKLCHCSVAFTNPNAEELEHVKRILIMRKHNIIDKHRT